MLKIQLQWAWYKPSCDGRNVLLQTKILKVPLFIRMMVTRKTIGPSNLDSKTSTPMGIALY